MKRVEKLTNSKYFLIFIFFILIKPGIFSEYTNFIRIGNIIDIFRIIIVCYVISMFFINKLELNKTYTLLIYYLILFIPTVLYNGDIFNLLINSINLLTWIILFNYNIKYNKNNFLDALEIIFYILIVINSITIFLYPGGMYKNSSGFLANYFLGYDNNFILFILPGISISYLNSYRKYNKLSKRTIILYIISLLSLIKSWTVTSLIVFILFTTIYILFLLKDKYSKLIKNILFCILLIIGFIMLIKYTNIYEYITVNILKKDTTLSSRTIIWRIYIDYINKQPILGYGVEYINELILKTGYFHAHNLYLNLLYQGGIIELINFICIIVLFYPKNSDKYSNFMKSIIISFLIGFIFKADTIIYMFFITLLLCYYLKDFFIKDKL